eukprot:541917-Prorocentrum_minimum.AAC.2
MNPPPAAVNPSPLEPSGNNSVAMSPPPPSAGGEGAAPPPISAAQVAVSEPGGDPKCVPPPPLFSKKNTANRLLPLPLPPAYNISRPRELTRLGTPALFAVSPEMIPASVCLPSALR